MAFRNRLMRYGIAAALVVIATAIRLPFASQLDDRVPFLSYSLAVVLAAWFGGMGPALAAAALSIVAALYYFMAPAGRLLPQTGVQFLSVLSFAVTSVVIALFSGSLRRARRRAEEQARLARDERERYFVTLSSIGDAVIATDSAGRVTFINRVAEQLTGWPQGESVGAPLERVFHIVNEKTGKPTENPVAKALRLGAVVGLANHTVLISRDGSRRAIDDSAAPIRDGSGRVVGVILVFRDVDEVRRLKLESDRMEAIVESSEDAILGMSFDLVATHWNEGARRMFGFTAEEVVGRPLTETILPADRVDELLAVYERVRRGERVDHFETQRRCRDGRLLDVSIRISPIRDEDGEIVGAAAIDRDITERLRYERELRRSEEELSDFFENAAVGLHWIGPDGTILRVNRDELEMLGYERDEYVGRHIAEFHADREVIDDILARLLRGELLQGVEARMRRKDGSLRTVLIDCSGLWEDGRFIHSRCFTRDVTEQKEAEEALRRSREALALVFNASPVAISVTTLDEGRFVEANPAFLERGGFRREEVIGRTSVELGLVDRDAREELVRTVREQRSLRGIELTVSSPATGPRLMLASIELIEFGGVPCLLSITQDITELKRTERQLRESEERLRLALEAGRMGTWEWIIGDGKVVWSSGLERIHGLKPGEFAGTFEAFQSDIHPEDRERVLATIRDTLAQRREHHLEHRIIAPDQSVRWLESRGRMILDERGEPQRMVGVCTDVTERKHLEETLLRRMTALTEAEERMRSVVDHVLDGIVTIDERGNIRTFNLAAEKLFGWKAEEVIGKHVRMLMPEQYHSEHDAYLSKYWETGEKVTDVGREVEGLRRDGSVFPMDLAVSEFHLEGERYFTGIIRDITEAKRHEATLRFLADASKSLAALVDYRSTLQAVAHLAVPDFADWCAVDIVNHFGQVERLAVAHVNPEKVEFVKRLQRESPANPDAPHGIQWVLRSGEPEFVAEIDDALLHKVAVDEEHLNLIRQLMLTSIIAVPLKAHDRILGVLTFATAESGRRFRPDDLAVAEDLARRATIAIENARLYQEVRTAGRRKDEFLAMLAHELRNPLAPIRSGLDILSMEPGGHKETIELMQRQVEHLVRLVDDLLDVSRIMRGKVELRRKPTRVPTIVRRAVEAVRWSIEIEEQELTVDILDESIVVDADPVRLVQVVENLLNNASKYTDRGGHIAVSVERRGDSVLIHVRDDGIGIDAELLPKIFDLFTQSNRTLDRAQGGLGIGLTLVRSLVEGHGGTVSARSAGPGQGSEFTVCLPTIDAEPVSDEGAPEPRSTLSRRILVVDDNVGAVRMLTMLLERLGPHEIASAHDGPSALQMITEFRPDVVLLDIGLPGMNGYEVAERVRRNPDFDDALLVALTGYGQEEDRRKSRQAGFDEHLVKPPALDQIASVLNRAPRRARLAADHPRPAPPRRPAASSRLVPSNERLGTFFRSLAHEIGNSIVPIRLMCELLKRPDVDPQSIATVTEMLDQHLPSMNRLVDDIRRIGRITGEGYIPRRDELESRALVDAAVADVAPRFAERGQKLELQIPESLPRLHGDAELLRRALSELLRNAADYSPPEERISLQAEQQNGDLVLHVRNPCENLQPEQIPHLFELFVRGEDRLDAEAGHWGIGLAFVRQVVELHGGRIDAHASSTSECEFTLRLPALPESPAHPPDNGSARAGGA